MVNRTTLIDFLDSNLYFPKLDDSSMNGLQIEGWEQIRSVGAAVDMSLQLVEHAIAKNLDIVIVHHGLFWQKPLAVTGPHKTLLHLCIEHKLNVYASHLPLDAHVDWGNNFSLGRLLELSELESDFEHRGHLIGCIGKNLNSQPLDFFTHKLANLEGASQPPLVLNFGLSTPKRVGIISGAGATAESLDHCLALGIDTFITGEPRQFAYHFARENNLNVIFAGHYATETLGVKNAAKAVADRFNLEWLFVNLPTQI